MAEAVMQPTDRYSLVGKTGSGKTALAMVLAAQFARALSEPWEVWWIDTKDDPDDLKALRKWGARNAMSDKDKETSLIGHRFKYWLVRPKEGLDVITQSQAIIAAAYERRHVLLCIDEFIQVVPSRQNMGEALLNVYQRGRGRKVGIIGLTQEPVFVPRQLLSQATHLVLLSLSHTYDIERVSQMVKEYQSPLQELHDKYGFWWKWVDGGSGEVVYYPNQRVWFEQLRIAKPRQSKEEELVEE